MKAKCSLLLASLFLVNGFVPTAAQAQEDQQQAVRKQLDADYARLSAAIEKNNSTQLVAVLLDLMAPGKMPEEMLSRTRQAVEAGGGKM